MYFENLSYYFVLHNCKFISHNLDYLSKCHFYLTLTISWKSSHFITVLFIGVKTLYLTLWLYILQYDYIFIMQSCFS